MAPARQEETECQLALQRFKEAREATMAAVEAAGYRRAADFLLTFSCSSKASVAADEAEASPSPSPLHSIWLVGGSFKCQRCYVNCYIMNEDLKWGENALCFEASADTVVRILHAIASIPRFTRLILTRINVWSVEKGSDAVLHALSSPNFSELVLHGFESLNVFTAGKTPVCNNSLRSIAYSACIDRTFCMLLWEKLIIPSLKCLTTLALEDFCDLDVARFLFTLLEESQHPLTNLSLSGSRTMGLTTTEVVDSLRRNGLLHNIDLTETDFEGDSAIALQLRKNAENSARLKSLGPFGLERERPSTVRLYLCGLPLSGKTTISRSIAECTKGSSSRWWSHRNTIKVSDRTRGIEVTTIENKQAQQRISIWDMAGQIEYHSFHDTMLPDISDRAAAPLILYVWNPCEMDAKNKIARNERTSNIILKSPDQFESDFRYWLKFIASKTVKSNMFKPEVIVAITRADLGLPSMKQYLESHFNALRNEFEDYIQFDMEGFFHVDARNSKMIFQLASHLFKCTKKILREAPHDLKVCDGARKLFTNLINDMRISPLITKETFFRLSREHLQIESEEVCEAVALSLTSSGDLMYFPSLELVVVDTQWFCQKIMGELLYFNMQSTNFAQLKGFFPVHYLEELLEEEFNSSRVNKHKFSLRRGASKLKESLKVPGDALVKLLIGLRLACRQNYNKTDPRIFIPASLCGKARERIMPSKYFKLDRSYKSYIGRRWDVKDLNCTFLTPGIFPLIQVTFHHILAEKNVEVTLDQDVMAFASEGASVFVEFCRLEGRGNFIDVLVGSLHTAKEGVDWMRENVTVQMKEVFADSRGLPGVELVEFAIQPDCIRAHLEARERQVVAVEVLRGKMREQVQRRGAFDGFECFPYTWQAEPVTHDPLVDLLGEVEVAKLVEAYRASLSEAARDVLLLSNAHDVVNAEGQISNGIQFGSSPSSNERERMFGGLCRLINHVHHDLKGDIKQLARQVEDIRGVVLPKLKEMFTFVQEGEAGRLPRMFVVTQEVGTVRSVVSKVVGSLHSLQLELLCECRNHPAHLVDGQRGLRITTLDAGLLKCGLPYINGFLKLAYVVTKIGAHVAFGFGEAIPDFTRVLAGIVDTAECGGVPTSFSLADDWKPSSWKDFLNGQQWLFDVLSHHNVTKGDQIYARLGLRRIRYANSSVAWVCNDHYSGGYPFPA